MFRLAVKVAALVAITALLLQSACAIGPGFTMTASETTPSQHSGCHEAAPVAPHAPDSRKICCSGKHSPEAIVSAVPVVAPLVLTDFIADPPFKANTLQRATDILSTPAGPPVPLVLRI